MPVQVFVMHLPPFLEYILLSSALVGKYFAFWIMVNLYDFNPVYSHTNVGLNPIEYNEHNIE